MNFEVVLTGQVKLWVGFYSSAAKHCHNYWMHSWVTFTEFRANFRPTHDYGGPSLNYDGCPVVWTFMDSSICLSRSTRAGSVDNEFFCGHAEQGANICISIRHQESLLQIIAQIVCVLAQHIPLSWGLRVYRALINVFDKIMLFLEP